MAMSQGVGHTGDELECFHEAIIDAVENCAGSDGVGVDGTRPHAEYPLRAAPRLK
jgi:hypothetical protein